MKIFTLTLIFFSISLNLMADIHKLPAPNSERYYINDDGTWGLMLNFDENSVYLNSNGSYQIISE